MKTKKIEVCDAVSIDVICKVNDIDDIKIGGPHTLGYDFMVSPDVDTIELISFIKKCLKLYKRPLININTNGCIKDFPVKCLWTKKNIEDCIKGNHVC